MAKIVDISKVEQTMFGVAAMFEELAQAECRKEYPNTSLIHWYVTEARRAGNLPRQLRLRAGL